MECSLSGSSKTQVIREFKERFTLNDDDIQYLLDSCRFKSKPKKINYLDFYKNKLFQAINNPFFGFILSFKCLK